NTQLRLIAVAAFGLSSMTADAQHPAMPPGMTHEEHLAQMQREADMKKRGTAAMRFDQDKVAHHFLMTADGGSIQVEVRDPSDQTDRDAIRAHLWQMPRSSRRAISKHLLPRTPKSRLVSRRCSV